MTVAHLAIFVVLGQVPDGDPADLMTRLGSPRFAERQEAAAALERLGREALPALREGLGSKDPEIRTRAEALASKIECELMVRSTPVTLDFRDRPLDEVVQLIAGRSQIPVALMPENAVFWRGRRVTLEEPQPVPFWTAIDRLCRAAQLSYLTMMPLGPGGSRRLVLQAAPGGAPTEPMCDSGPFRVALLAIDQHRNRSFNAPRAGVAVQHFCTLQLLAEPRLMISQGGPVKVLEAVDDQGRSLVLPAAPGAPIQRYAGYTGYSLGAGASGLQIQVHLKPPDAPGQSLKALRGSIPLTVTARKPDALMIPLDGAAGKTFPGGETALKVHELRADPLTRQTTLDLTVSSPDRPGAAIPGSPEFGGYRLPELVQNRIEILDARGQVIPAIRTSQSQGLNGETRLTLTLQPADGAGVATHIRYYDLARTTAEAAFEFTDIPLP